MTDRFIQFNVPDEIYERVQQVAEASHLSFEMVLVESLNLLFGQLSSADDLEKQLNDLSGYSDAQLWAVVHSRMAWKQSLRLRELTAKSKQSRLSDTEQEEQERLLDTADRYVLLRSEALVQLKLRGHDVSAYFNSVA